MAVYKRRRKGGGFYPHWYFSITVDGVRERRSTGVPIRGGPKSKALAEDIEAQARLATQEGRHFPGRVRRRMSVGELRDLVLKERAHQPSAPNQGSCWKRIVRLLGERTPITALNEDRLALLREEMENDESRGGRRLAQSSVNRHLAYLHAALERARELGAFVQAPSVPMRPEAPPRDRIWSHEEVTGYMEIVEPELRLAIAIGYWTGLRLGAIADLSWSDVNLESRIIKVPLLIEGKPRAFIVPIHKDLAEVLQAEMGDGKIFKRKRAARWLSEAFYSVKRQGVVGLATDMTMHDLRHSAATNLWEAGADIMTIAAITGHRSLRSLQRYLTARPKQLLAAIDRVPSMKAEQKQDAGLEAATTDDLMREIQRRLQR